MLDRFGQAMGVWTLRVKCVDTSKDKEEYFEESIQLKPELKDSKAMLEILNRDYSKAEQYKRTEAICNKVIEIAQRTHNLPTGSEELTKIENFVWQNPFDIMTETMIRWRYTTREELEKSKQRILEKNLNDALTQKS